MKKFLEVLVACLILLVVMFLLPAVAEAGTPYGVDLSSISVTLSTTSTGIPITPFVSGGVSLTSLTLSNSGSTAQTVTFYKNATSTSAISAVFTVVLPAAAGFYRPVGDIDLYSLISLTNMTARKSSPATDVHMYFNCQ